MSRTTDVVAEESTVTQQACDHGAWCWLRRSLTTAAAPQSMIQPHIEVHEYLPLEDTNYNYTTYLGVRLRA